jgi:hypothetical protein
MAITWKKIAYTDNPTFTGNVTVPDPTVGTDAVNLQTMLNSVGVSLNFWLQASNVLGNEYANAPVARTEAISSSPQTLSTIYYKSAVAITPTPFVIKDGTIVITHFQAKVNTVEAPAKTCSVKTQLFYVDADGTSNPVQIGSDSNSTIPLTTSQVTFNTSIDIAGEVNVPEGKRLWLKFVVTRTSAEYAPTISIWDGDVHDHVSIPVAGSVLGRYLQLSGGTLTGNLGSPGQTITAIRGTELAPAITEANWDTNVAGWVHPVVGGVLDKGSAGDWAQVVMTTPIVPEVGDVYEITFTIGNSPTTGTYVQGGGMGVTGATSWDGFYPLAAGTYTYYWFVSDVEGICIAGSDTSRFGISAISIKKVTEGHLAMNGGQIKARRDNAYLDVLPAYSFDGDEDTGMQYYYDGVHKSVDIVVDGTAKFSAHKTKGIWTGAPTSGTANYWKLGSVVNNEIEVEVGGDTVKRMLVTTTSLAAGTEQIRGTTKEIFKTASADSPLTAAECAGTIVSNYGMTDADCTIELPAAAEGLSFVCILPAVQTHFFKLHAGATDKIYLSGVAGSDNGNVGVASGYATGASASFFTFKASDGGYDWFCLPLHGAWVAS